MTWTADRTTEHSLGEIQWWMALADEYYGGAGANWSESTSIMSAASKGKAVQPSDPVDRGRLPLLKSSRWVGDAEGDRQAFVGFTLRRKRRAGETSSGSAGFGSVSLP